MRSVLAATAFLVMVLGASGVAEAQEPVVPVETLLADAAARSGTSITVEGELVGDYGFRRDGTMWTQLNDDSYARQALVDGGPRTGANVGIGIRMPQTLAAGLDPAGGYRLEGPLVRATGVWKYHDPDRGGESYLDVIRLEVMEGGRALEVGPDWLVLFGGLATLAASFVLWRTARRDD